MMFMLCTLDYRQGTPCYHIGKRPKGSIDRVFGQFSMGKASPRVSAKGEYEIPECVRLSFRTASCQAVIYTIWLLRWLPFAVIRRFTV